MNMLPDFDKVIDRKNTDCIKYDATQLMLGAEVSLPMWIADMDFEAPPYIIQALHNRVDHSIFGYAIRCEEYYKSIIAWLERHHQWSIQKDWILFSPGVVPAINLAVLQLTQPGDKIILQPPVYYPFFAAIKDHGRETLYNNLKEVNGRLTMDFEDFEEKAKQGAKMLILCNPHNPGGSVWKKDELKKLAEICLKYNIIIFSDEIHSDLVYKPNKHTPMASISPEVSDITITAISPGKTFNISGLSTASTIISNKDIRHKINSLAESLHIASGNIFGNRASVSAYTNGDEYVEALLAYLMENVQISIDFFKKHTPKIKAAVPESTFMLWLDCTELGLNDEALKDFFLNQAKVGLNPGVMFGHGGEGHMRMNIGCPKTTLMKGLELIKEAYDKL